MNKRSNVVGIDVGKRFCYVYMMNASFETILHPFKMTNTVEGMTNALSKIKKATGIHDVVIVFENTNNYSDIIQRFFSNYTRCIPINPVITHKQSLTDTRKRKTDKRDSVTIAKAYLVNQIKSMTVFVSDTFRELRVLTRNRSDLVKTRTGFKNKYSSLLYSAYPGMDQVWHDLWQKSANATMKYLIELNSDKAFDIDALTELINKTGRRGHDWAHDKAKAVKKVIEDRMSLGSYLRSETDCIMFYLDLIEQFDKKLDEVEERILAMAHTLTEVQLLVTIPGVSAIAAATIIAEIVTIKRFKKAKQLVAFCGTDPRVNQSGDKNAKGLKITKAGNSYLRDKIYTIALVSLNSNPKAGVQNPVISKYYKDHVKYKKKKVVIVAIMNKILRYVFSVLTNAKPFEIITPEDHVKRHLSLVA